MRSWRTIIALAGLGVWLGVGVPAFAADIPNPANPAEPARPGTVNYIEGAAYLNGTPLNEHNIGSAELDAGQMLTTGAAGKAEILLTPGIFLRVDSDSTVKMISPDLAQTQVELEQGRAAWKWIRSFRRT